MNTENNKLIDNFMGSNGEYHSHKDAWGSEIWGEYKPNRYHSDWNRLMEVVEKCYGIKADYSLHKKIEDAFIYKTDNRIESVYNACVEFIKWYNENKFGSVK